MKSTCIIQVVLPTNLKFQFFLELKIELSNDKNWKINTSKDLKKVILNV